MKRELPPIPRSIMLPAGRAYVVRERGLQEREQSVGKFCWSTRIITLDADLKGSAAWLTLAHERVHVVLIDAGVHLSEELEERVADALAQDMVADMVRKLNR